MRGGGWMGMFKQGPFLVRGAKKGDGGHRIIVETGHHYMFVDASPTGQVLRLELAEYNAEVDVVNRLRVKSGRGKLMVREGGED